MSDAHHQGLSNDLELLTRRAAERRRLLGWALGTGLVGAIGCVVEDSTASSAGAATDFEDPSDCSAIPEETAGPYPGDGSNGKNALTLSGIVRSDITASIAGASGVAEGVPLTVKLKVVDASGCGTLAGKAVYLWHCDRDGNYSMYSSAVASENYLRGVQETDDEGVVTFTTIFPACYSGRWPHIHFEVYPSIDDATDAGSKIATSQLALPEATCDEVYATSGYEASIDNLAGTSLDSDNVFGDDGGELQIPAVSGSVEEGFVVSLVVAV